MRRFGLGLLGGGGLLCLLTLFVFVSTNASHDELAAGPIDTTPYFVWGTIGGFVIVLGAIFYAAGEVVRLLGDGAPATRPREKAPVSHWD